MLLSLSACTFSGFILSACTPWPPGSEMTSRYVGTATCASCHASEYEAWKTSDHRRAMEVPSDSTVLAAFDGRSVVSLGESFTFVKRDSTFVVVIDGDSVDVAYTFGYDPLQQFLLPAHGGRLQAPSVAWDVEKETWYSLYSDTPGAGNTVLGVGLASAHWKSANLNWNYMCADCHSTGLDRGYDLSADSYNTTWEELTVGCEACHGPGEAHVEWARSSGEPDARGAQKAPNARGAPNASNAQDPFAMPIRTEVKPGLARASFAMQDWELNTCARCHSRRIAFTPSFEHAPIITGKGSELPGLHFLDQYGPALIGDSLYFADGQIREEVFVYGSFMQSKMAAKGVTCSDCHEPHSGRIRASGNALCSSCHAASYDTAQHTLHIPQSEAAQCVTCHMPARTYMGIDARRDHRFGVPDPGLSAASGSPDVCASCHPGRSSTWADEKIALLRSRSASPRAAQWGKSVTRAVVALESGQEDALAVVRSALSDTLSSSFAKAGLLARLGSVPGPEAARHVLLALDAPDPAIRVGALRALSGWAGQLPAPDLNRLLADGVRWVRLEAVSSSLALGSGVNWEDEAPAVALAEFIHAQNAVGERPEAHINLGRMYESLGQMNLAESEFETAVRLDSTSADLWLEMALFRGREASLISSDQPKTYFSVRNQAEAAFRRAASLAGAAGSDILYLFGLFIAEDLVRLPDAATLLARSSDLDPTQTRKAYNAGVAYQQLKEMTRAERYLTRAQSLGLIDASEALITLYIQTERWSKAAALNDTLLRQFPERNDLMERKAYIDEAFKK